MKYEYKAKVVSVYDGDTVTVDIDLGFGVMMHKQKIRLFGINTPEVRGAERTQGLESKNALIALLDEYDNDITIRTYKDKKGKYGRWIGELFVGSTNINAWLVENGYAVYREY